MRRFKHDFRQKNEKSKKKSLKEAVLHYAREGFYVVPCNGKIPLLKKWPEKASKGPEQIKFWWKRWPDANIGIAVGKSDLLVLDIDGPEGIETYERQRAESGEKAKKTPTQRTGGGGFQKFYKRPSGGCKNRTKFLPGLDIKCDGGLAIVPPSVHESGKRYKWQEGRSLFDRKPARVPQWLQHLLDKEVEKEATGGASSNIDFVRILKEGIPEGSRDDSLLALLHNFYTRGFRTQEELEKWGFHFRDTIMEKGRKPYTDEEVRKTVSQVFNFRSEPDTSGGGMTGLEVWDCSDPPPQWVFKDFLMEGCCLMGAPAKAGKSWIGYEMALSIVTGRRCFNHFDPTGKAHVLYLALEESKANLKQRLRMLMEERRKELKHIDFRFDWPQGTKAVDKIGTYLEEHPETRLVVIDPLFAIRRGRHKSEDLVQSDYEAIAVFRRLADQHKVSFLIIHHTSKLKTNNPFERISGTGGLTAASHHNMIYDGKPMGNGGRIQVVGKTGPCAEFAVEFHEANGQMRPVWRDAKEYALSGVKRIVFDELKDCDPSMWLTPKEISELRDELKPAAVRKALMVLKREDMVETCPTGPKGQGLKYRLRLSLRKDLDALDGEEINQEDNL